MKIKAFQKHLRPGDPFAIGSERHKLYKPSDRKYLAEISEGAKFLNLTKEHLGRNFNFNKVFYLKIIVFALLALLVGRGWWLQGAKGKYFLDLAEGNRLRIRKVEAKRGIIYDRNHQPLVHNVANFVLYFVPADLPTGLARQEIVNKLAGILETVKSQDINGQLEKIEPKSYEAYQPLFVADNIDYEKALKIYLESSKMPGVFLDSKSRREYDQSSQSLAHVMGYTGKINAKEMSQYGDDYSMLDYVGKIGLEDFYENELKGISGRKQVEVDALGKESRVISQTPIEDGHNLLLSIDLPSQIKLEQLLSDELKIAGKTKGVAIASDPRNGEIIAMVSLPAYSNNIFARGITSAEYRYLADQPDQPLFNRAISGEYPAGSTVKPVVAAGALDAGVVDEHSQFLSNGGLRINQWTFPDWKAGGHGLTDVRKALADSVNTYFYIVGGGYQDVVGLGFDRLLNYFKLFGLGAQTGIDLPSEAKGFLPTKEWKFKTTGERWYIGDTYHLSIGQGYLLATPLQINYYTNYFANGGSFYRPHLVRSFLTGDDQVFRIEEILPVKSGVVSDGIVQIVREGMRQGVTEGSSKRLSILPVTVAGKTGTAQFSSNKEPHAWWTGFAPYEEPTVSLTVLVEEGVEGSRTSIAVADGFLRWYFGERLHPATGTVPIFNAGVTSTTSTDGY
ncbi:MAG: penicillin-binding protein 2 [Candidatus Falkowbacteria bacterium]